MSKQKKDVQVNNTNLSQNVKNEELIEKSKDNSEIDMFWELMINELNVLCEYEKIVIHYNELLDEFDEVRGKLFNSNEVSEKEKIELELKHEDMDNILNEMESEIDNYDYPEDFYEDILSMSDEEKIFFCLLRIQLKK